MRHLIAWILLVGVLAAPALSQPLPAASTQIVAVLIGGNPSAGGQIIAVMALDAPATREVQSATYAALRIGARKFVFAVARVATVGAPVGSTVVRLRDGSRLLSEVAQLLAAALSGKMDLVILTQGPLDRGVITAVVPLDPRSRERVATDGATQATIFRAGRETTIAIRPGRAGPMLVLDGSEGESECRFCDGMGAGP